MRYALAIKQADPTALVAGPVGDNRASLWFSKRDTVAGWSSRSGNYGSNPVDRNAHGGVALLPWYLQQFLAPANIAFAPAGDSATQALRLRSTRTFWDPNHVVSDGCCIIRTFAANLCYTINVFDPTANRLGFAYSDLPPFKPT
jgi:hypothetical protein